MNETVTANLIRSGVILILAAVIYGLLIRYGYRLVERYAAKQSEKETGARILTLWKVMRRVILLIFIFTTVLVLFGVWGISVVPFLALGTVLAAAIGFGAQDLVKDIIAGFFMLLEDQFHLGDTITIAGVTGTVEDIQLRVTVLRDLEGNEIFVPNGQVTVTSNYTSHFARPVIDVGVAYDTDVDHAMAVLSDELNKLAADPEWSDKISGDCEILGVNELGDSAVVLRARLTTDADERWSVRREALRRVKKRFDAEEISIPFPQVTVHRAD